MLFFLVSNVVVQVLESAFIVRNYFWTLPKEIRKEVKKKESANRFGLWLIWCPCVTRLLLNKKEQIAFRER